MDETKFPVGHLLESDIGSGLNSAQASKYSEVGQKSYLQYEYQFLYQVLLSWSMINIQRNELMVHFITRTVKCPTIHPKKYFILLSKLSIQGTWIP